VAEVVEPHVLKASRLSEVAEHYGVSPEDEEPHASTLDYVVAAAGG